MQPPKQFFGAFFMFENKKNKKMEIKEMEIMEIKEWNIIKPVSFFNMGKASIRMYLLSRTRTPPIGESAPVLSRKVHTY